LSDKIRVDRTLSEKKKPNVLFPRDDVSRTHRTWIEHLANIDISISVVREKTISRSALYCAADWDDRVYELKTADGVSKTVRVIGISRSRRTGGLL